MKTKAGIIAVNTLLLTRMVLRVIEIDRDRGHILYLFYPILFIVNALTAWFLSWRGRRLLSPSVVKAAFVLIIFFIPGAILLAYFVKGLFACLNPESGLLN